MRITRKERNRVRRRNARKDEIKQDFDNCCYICLQSNPMKLLSNICKCTTRVHSHCLDAWRQIHTETSRQCGICTHKYQFRTPETGKRAARGDSVIVLFWSLCSSRISQYYGSNEYLYSHIFIYGLIADMIIERFTNTFWKKLMLIPFVILYSYCLENIGLYAIGFELIHCVLWHYLRSEIVYDFKPSEDMVAHASSHAENT